jgi:hypothetical protein
MRAVAEMAEEDRPAWSAIEKVIAVAIVILVTVTVFAQVYKAGANKGYAQGWQDAHCGAGNSCESGDN